MESSNYSGNICFDCKKACGGCSWSGIDKNGNPRFEPVPSWTAEPVAHMSSGKYLVETYHITDCPQFEQEEKRDRGCTYLTLTKEESDAFLLEHSR